MRSAIAFLTAFGGDRAPGPATLDWFPPTGALIGLLVGFVWWAAARAWSPGPAAAVTVCADLVVTGMLHLDGLADSADGLLPPVSRARRLEIMAGSDTGAFGVGVVAAVLLLRYAALAAMRPAVAMVAALWCLSRSMMAGVVRFGRYAREGRGLPSAFAGTGRGRAGHGVPVVLGTLAAFALAAIWNRTYGPVAVAAAAVGGGAVLAVARRRIGGYTGDVLGASALVGETVGLLVAAARW